MSEATASAVKRYLHVKEKINTVCLPFFRCFLSAGSPVSSPARSRVVEAICIHLCQRHPHARKEVCGERPRHNSRWKLILQDYSRVHARVTNSLALLEGTNLQLFTINERTLMAWHKNTTRVQEVSMLMQGLYWFLILQFYAMSN